MTVLLERMLLLPGALLALSVSYAHAAQIEARAETTSIPAPIAINPDQNWDGIDGSWSTFTLRVGTPEQYVRTLVSTASYQTWVVLPEGCAAAADQTTCRDERGRILEQNSSTTFDRIGIYDLYIEKNLGYNGNAIYGYDTVGLGGNGEGGPTIQNTTVGGLAVEDFYLGVFGVNPKPTNFTSFNDGSPSYMTKLYEQNYIPSISFGFTAGAKYRSTGVLASLTLGGYDTGRFVENGVTFKFAADNERDVVVAIQSINTPSQDDSSPVATGLLPSPIYAYIDSTVPQIWLPLEACQAFELEFGLTYDNETELYLVNDTLHQSLLDRDASVVFTIGQGFTSRSTIEITLPYAAFDLEAQPPYQGLANASRYFPLQRAQNETQYTLGRAFLQEAYLSVDWESAVFNVSQVAWNETLEQHLVPILPSQNNAAGSGSGVSGSSGSDDKSSGLSTGAIAGIAVGAAAVLALLVVVLFWYFYRKRRTSRDVDNEKPDPNAEIAAGVGGQQHRHVYPKAELESNSTPIAENKRLLSANGSSAPGTPRSLTSPSSAGYFQTVNGHSVPSTPSAGEGTHSSTNSGQLFTPISAGASEADSRERQVYEMPGDMPTIREKDGKALSEKEALQHRERLYNGVDSAPSSTRAISEGVREPRRISPSEIVETNESLERRDMTVHRAFSFEMSDSDRELCE